jgi:hypothetical protein
MQRLYRNLNAGTLFVIFPCGCNDLSNYESLPSSLSVVQVGPQIVLRRPTDSFHQHSGRVFLGSTKLPLQAMS